MEQFALYPHQKLSVEYHLKARYSLDGSEMGTGKTAVALEYIKRIGLKALVVCPAFLLTNWKREAYKLGVREGLIQYIPYSKIHQTKAKEISGCRVWVADEVHFLKNPTAKRTHAFYGLFKEVQPDYFLGLSGTLVKNKVPDLWVPLAICSKNPVDTNGIKLSGELSKYRAFSRYFCHAEVLNVRGVRIEKFTGVRADRLPELRGLLVDKYRRVQLSEVAADLPTMTRQEFHTQVRPVAGLEEAFDIYMAGGGADPTSKALSALLKSEDTATYAGALIEEGEAVIIFSDHIKSAQDIATRLGAPCVTGQMSAEKRSALVDTFQSGKIKVLVATIGSLSVGVTLTAARHVIFNDLSWCASDNDQAAARILRIGQSRPCFSHYTIGSPTDEKIMKVLTTKSFTSERVLS